jgi:hypothetical protein
MMSLNEAVLYLDRMSRKAELRKVDPLPWSNHLDRLASDPEFFIEAVWSLQRELREGKTWPTPYVEVDDGFDDDPITPTRSTADASGFDQHLGFGEGL